MARRRRVSQWFEHPWVVFPFGVLMVTFLVILDGSRLRDSALWGSSEWILGALAGLGVAMIGILLAVRAIYRQATGHRSVDRFPTLGIAYTAVMVVVFILTHRRHSPQPSVDTPLMVAALTAQVVLAVGLAGLLVLMAVRRLQGEAQDAPE